MSTTKQLINAIIEGDAVTIQDAFNQAMVERIADRLDMMRQDVARNMFKEEVQIEEDLDLEDLTLEELEEFMQTEDYQQLDELSKKTLASYVAKASRDAADRAVQHGIKKAESDELDRTLNRHMDHDDKDKIRAIMKTTTKDVWKPKEKAVKRLRGIERAASRLAKEGFNLEDYSIDELEDFMMSEDFEQLDELSKATLGSYIRRAAADAVSSGRSAGVELGAGANKRKDFYKKYEDKAEKRRAGISRAVERLAKEEFNLEDYSIDELEEFMMSEDFEQLDELSKKTLSNYVAKASRDAADKAVQHGIKKAESDELDRTLNRHMSNDDKDKIRSIMKTTTKDVWKPKEKAVKRLRGIERAASRLAKEEADLSEDTLLEFTHGKEYSQKQILSRIQSGNWEAVTDVKPGKHVELRHHTGKRVTVYVK